MLHPCKKIRGMAQCIVCDGTNTPDLYPGILRCSSCDYVFADLNLTDDDFFAIYRNNYFFGDEYSNYPADRNVLQRNFTLRWNVLQTYLDPKQHQSLVEIGCAYGFFLDLVRSEFREMKGFDVNEEAIKYAKEDLKLDVACKDFLKAQIDGIKFDVACLWDTIEHLRAPHLYLEKLSKHMNSGSILAITTGDIESLNARVKKSRWRMIHPPSHAHYFSPRTLRKLLARYGFEVIHSEHAGQYRSIDNIAHNLFVLRWKTPSLYEVAKKFNRDIYTNLYDISFVIAAKI
jgi:hypothetical protein